MKKRKFSEKTLEVIDEVKKIIKEYDGKPTTMQIFQSMGAYSTIEISKAGYKRLVKIIGHARKAGLIGWDDIYGTKQPREDNAQETK